MNRREFVKSSMALAGTAAVFNLCSAEGFAAESKNTSARRRRDAEPRPRLCGSSRRRRDGARAQGVFRAVDKEQRQGT